MEEAIHGGSAFSSARGLVSVPRSSFKLSSNRRLSAGFRRGRSSVTPFRRRLAGLSVQGLLAGAEEELTSSQAVGCGLRGEEAVAWELFSPLERVLVVAAAAAASSGSKKDLKISQLQRSVEIRDQLLSSMQQKLDNLFDQTNYTKDIETVTSLEEEAKTLDSFSNECSCQCENCKSSRKSSLDGGWNSSTYLKMAEKASSQDEIFKMPEMNNGEQEERRMSDLSDWCPSVTSSVEFQMNALAPEKDIYYNLQKELEEKDATIKELTNIAHASDIACSKRISDLEDIIRRKNTMITKLKKDILVYEQKVLHLTRLRRPSFSVSNSDYNRTPVMANNLLYDMESSTSPSSSDSDCTAAEKERCRSEEAPFSDKSENTPRGDDFSGRKNLSAPPAAKRNKFSSSGSKEENRRRRPVSPLKENSVRQSQRDGSSTKALRLRPPPSSVGDAKNRRRLLPGSKDLPKRLS